MTRHHGLTVTLSELRNNVKTNMVHSRPLLVGCHLVYRFHVGRWSDIHKKKNMLTTILLFTMPYCLLCQQGLVRNDKAGVTWLLFSLMTQHCENAACFKYWGSKRSDFIYAFPLLHTIQGWKYCAPHMHVLAELDFVTPNNRRFTIEKQVHFEYNRQGRTTVREQD